MTVDSRWVEVTVNEGTEINLQELPLISVISYILFSVKYSSTFQDQPNLDIPYRKAETSVWRQRKLSQAADKAYNSSAGIKVASRTTDWPGPASAIVLFQYGADAL